jgi:oligoribonuclease
MAGTQDSGNLIWLDLEMTGLDANRDVLLEVATLVTGPQLEILAEGPNLTVLQPESVLLGMDEWCRTTHGQSGLTERVRQEGRPLLEVEARTMEFVSAWVPRGKSPLCGNSISHDRRWVRRYLPKLEDWLHYRNVDVSTVKELVRRWYPESVRPPKKKGAHRALDDIRESIEELRWYREHVFVPPEAARGAI